MAHQFQGKEFTFTQPDGTEFRVRGWGDQHYARFETLDGQAIVQDPATGYYRIASLSDDGDELEPTSVRADEVTRSIVPRGVESASAIRVNPAAAKARGLENSRIMIGGRRCEERRERRLRQSLSRGGLLADGPNLAPPGRGTVGDFVGLCLLIDFADEPATISQQEVDDFCNKKGYTGFGNNGSVNNYFLDNSFNSFNYTNIVTSYYRAKNPKSYYTDPTVKFGSRARALIKEALDYIKAEGFIFEDLSVDDQGYIYALNIYYAGSNDNNWTKGLWPHSWHLATKYSVGNGRYIYDYQFTNMSDELTLGTFCHENGHMVCDYPDLYDYGSESSGVGVYCLMCTGNHREKNPSQISAYLKHLSGWSSKATKMTHGATLSLDASKNEFAIFQHNENEYYIVENRLKAGRDSSLPTSGLAIWHVDEFGSNNNEQMEPAKHYELSLEQADNKFDLEKKRHHKGSEGDLYSATAHTRFADSTEPNSQWWDGSASNLDIYDISESGEIMSFKVKLYEDEENQTRLRQTSEANLDIPDNSITGVTDTLNFASALILKTIDITVDISHTYRGDLTILLSSPSGDTVILQDRKANDSGDDIKQSYDMDLVPELSVFKGKPVAGDWVLTVQDLARKDIGTLNHWELDIEGEETEKQLSLVLEDLSGLSIPDNDPVGIEAKLETDLSGSIKEISVLLEISHSYISDLKVSLQSPTGHIVDLHKNTGGSVDNIFKTYTQENTPSLLDVIDTEVAGEWKLKVVDTGKLDIGKLNRWQLSIDLND